MPSYTSRDPHQARDPWGIAAPPPSLPGPGFSTAGHASPLGQRWAWSDEIEMTPHGAPPASGMAAITTPEIETPHFGGADGVARRRSGGDGGGDSRLAWRPAQRWVSPEEHVAQLSEQVADRLRHPEKPATPLGERYRSAKESVTEMGSAVHDLFGEAGEINRTRREAADAVHRERQGQRTGSPDGESLGATGGRMRWWSDLGRRNDGNDGN